MQKRFALPYSMPAPLSGTPSEMYRLWDSIITRTCVHDIMAWWVTGWEKEEEKEECLQRFWNHLSRSALWVWLSFLTWWGACTRSPGVGGEPSTRRWRRWVASQVATPALNPHSVEGELQVCEWNDFYYRRRRSHISLIWFICRCATRLNSDRWIKPNQSPNRLIKQAHLLPTLHRVPEIARILLYILYYIPISTDRQECSPCSGGLSSNN